jgi:hypothetical protein
MVLSEVARDPPSPFLTVQADCDSVVLPTVTPPVADVAAVVAAASWSQPAPAGPFADCSSGSSSDAVNGSRQQHQQQQQPAPPPPQLQRQYSSGSFSRRPDALAQRSNLQSIVSQQSLNLGAPPDSPLEFELALSSIAAAAGGPSEQAKHQQLLAAAAAAATGASHGGEGGCSSSSTAGHRASNGASSSAQAQHGDAWRPKGLRFLPRNHGGWLRTSKSLPQHKRQPPSPLKGAPEASASSASTLLPDHHALGRVLKVQVNKLLSWAANGSSSASSSRQSHPGALPNPSAARGASPARHSAGGAVLINAGGSVSSIQSQQQQQWPVPWQHQLFSESPVAGSHSASGECGPRHALPCSCCCIERPPTAALCVRLYLTRALCCPCAMPCCVSSGVPMRSPRASLVSSPSSCDCPVFLGRYSSAGGDGYGHSYSPAGVASSSLVSSRSCSVASSPSPGKLAGPTAAASAAAAGAGDALVGGPLVATTSVRLPHYRHRQHRPGCRHYVCEQQQQQQVLSHGGGSLHLQQPSPRSQNGALPQQYQQQPSPLSHCSGMQQPLHAPVSPSTGMLQSQGSLRTALQQLESMASLKAARIMDKLNAGLLKMTSHRVFDGMAIKCSVAGREVRGGCVGAALSRHPAASAQHQTCTCARRTRRQMLSLLTESALCCCCLNPQGAAGLGVWRAPWHGRELRHAAGHPPQHRARRRVQVHQQAGHRAQRSSQGSAAGRAARGGHPAGAWSWPQAGGVGHGAANSSAAAELSKPS